MLFKHFYLSLSKHNINQQPVPTQQQHQIQQYGPQPATPQQQQKQFNLEHSALSQNDKDTLHFLIIINLSIDRYIYIYILAQFLLNCINLLLTW
jgi:hypothetical protein